MKKGETIFRYLIVTAAVIISIRALISLADLYLDKSRIAQEDDLIDELNKYTLDDYAPADQEKKYIESITVSAKRTIKPQEYSTARAMEAAVTVSLKDEFDELNPQDMAIYLGKTDSRITDDLTAIRDSGFMRDYFKKGVQKHFKCQGEKSYYCFNIDPKYASESKEYKVTDYSLTRSIELTVSDKKSGEWDKYRYEHDLQDNMTGFVKTDSSWDNNTEKIRLEKVKQKRKQEEAEQERIRKKAADKKGQSYSSKTTYRDIYDVNDYEDAQSFADDKYEEFYDYEDDFEDEDEAYDAAEEYWYENH